MPLPSLPRYLRLSWVSCQGPGMVPDHRRRTSNVHNKGYTYYRGSEQRHTRAPFLLLVQDRDSRSGQLTGIGPKSSYEAVWTFHDGGRQGRKSLTVSGSYGGDGLPMDVDKDVYDKGVDVPRRLYDLWSKGGGWNSAGSGAQEMRRWVKDTFRKEEL